MFIEIKLNILKITLKIQKDTLNIIVMTKLNIGNIINFKGFYKFNPNY